MFHFPQRIKKNETFTYIAQGTNDTFTMIGYSRIDKQQSYNGEMFHLPQRIKKKETFTSIAQRTNDKSQTQTYGGDTLPYRRGYDVLD